MLSFSIDDFIPCHRSVSNHTVFAHPDGNEAWADYRRGRNFIMYPVANSENADLPNPNTQWIRRIPFLLSEKQNNKAAVDAAVSLLGSGGDKLTTPLWWDKN